MHLDEIMPTWDATRREDRVIDGDPATVYAVALEADFLDAFRRSPASRLLVGVRSAGEKVVSAFRHDAGDAAEPEPEPTSLRLADMTEHGEWVVLAKDPSREIVFGTVGKFWAGSTRWETIDASQFTTFDPPGMAKIACNLSFRDYGEHRTLVSYEARTKATDEESRRAFLRYWRPLSPFIGVIMRSMLKVIDQDTTASA